MKRKIITSDDGSHTIYVPELKEHYHSTFGAISESMHIFINEGFNCIDSDEINILEIGFGTGLNAVLTYTEALKAMKKVNFYTIEKYPLIKEEWEKLNYFKLIPGVNKKLFRIFHDSEWEKWIEINDHFKLFKTRRDIKTFQPDRQYDLVYFDAFAPDIQPELWSESIFHKIYQSMNMNGVIVTYSVKGSVQRAMKSTGIKIIKCPGPKGKREILKGIKEK